MDVLKKQLERVQQQIAGLSASQKMLTASLVAIMVMTFLWWGRYAGTSEMEPVLNQSLSADEMTNVKRVLKGEGINFQASGDRILVPTEQKDSAIAALLYEQALPKDSSGNFEDVISKMSPFASPQMNDKMSNEMLQQNLARIVGKMRGVSEAAVMIDPTHDRLIGGNVEPRASVSVRMRSGSAADKKLAEAIAETVSGTNAHMKRSRVSVIIDDRVWPIRDRDASMPDGEIDEQQASAERRNEEKIKEALHYFTGDVIAVVHAKIDTVASQKSQTTYPKIQSKERSSETESSNTSTPQPSSAEPGAAANTGVAIPAAQTTSANSTTETERGRSDMQLFPDSTTEQSSKPAGEAKVTSATVSVPRSYFINMLKSTGSVSTNPDPVEIEKVFVAQRAMILAQVMHAVDLTDEKQVSVDMYFDAPLMLAAGASSTSASSAAATTTLSLAGHVKEIAIGLLALLSLFMVSMMVRKSTPSPVMAAVIESQEPRSLGGTIDIAGEVSEGGQMLDGMELDEDAVKAQQMVEQVSTMVKENPDSAATMVKRWLNHS